MMHQILVTDCAVLMETHFDFKGKEDSKSEIEREERREREKERFERYPMGKFCGFRCGVFPRILPYLPF